MVFPANMYRAQVVMQGTTGLAEDRFVNTFHFEDDLGTRTHDQVADQVVTLLDRFYTDATTANALQLFMPADLLEPTVEVRVYRMADLEPREPEIRTFTAVWGTAAPLPSEVAFVLSWTGMPKVPSRRGRTYLGPLTIAAQTNDGTTSRPLPGLIAAATLSGQRLLNESYAADVSLKIYSPTQNQLHVIYDCWADDAWDTQRKRGVAPTGRTTLERTSG